MLKELTRADWLSILNIPQRRIPLALLVRGTRSLKHWYRLTQEHFTNVLELGTPNSILDDLFVADLGSYPVAYASVYGAAMSSDVAHVTAATFAVAKHFGMDRTSLLYVFDNPRRKEHIFLDDAEKAERRRLGNARMMELVLDLIRAYGARQ